MKKSKKLLSVFLALALVITLMPAMTVPSQAKSDVSVSSMAQLKNCLEGDGYQCAVLQKDITGHADADYEFWCTIKGSKMINLNGHDIDISNDNSRSRSTLFNVPAGADLTVYDSEGSGDSNIHFDGYINDAGSYRNRSIFEVSGKLYLNGVTVEAGRSKSFYSAKYAKTVWKQIFGAAITANSGSKVWINCSTLFGRGDNITAKQAPSYGRNAGLIALSGSTVNFNDGKIKAKGGANCFNIYSGATVKVMNGTFTCDKLDAIKCDGSITSGIGKGRVGIPDKSIGMFATVASSNASDGKALDASSARIAPTGNSTGTLTAKSGDTVTENGKTVHRLLSSNPKVEFDTDGDFSGASTYFANVNIGTYGVDYEKYHTMKVYKDGVLVKTGETHPQGQTTFNVYNDAVAGFNPEKGVTYNLVCEFEEVLNGVHAKGRTADFYFKIVDDTAAPVITSQPPTDIYYENNSTVSLTVNATGSNLNYAWQYKKPGDSWVQSSTEKTNTIKAGPLTAADDGTLYRCAVTNSKGTAWSQVMTLHYKQNKIEKIDLSIDAPVHGVPLDFTATTSTAGCKVISVQWDVLMGDKVGSGYTPYAGQTLTATIIVQEDGKTFADNAAAYIGSQRYSTKSYPAANQLRFSFAFDVAAPASGDVAIDTAWLQVTEPAVGSKPGYLSIIQDGPYDGTYSRDVRFTDGSTQWFCNTAPMSMTDTFQSGNTYAVQTVLTPSKGWKFTSASKAELNGEGMYVTLQDGKLIVSQTFVMDEMSDPSLNPFVDVFASDYYYDAVLWAYYHEPYITNGIDETHFGPNQTVTRGQCVAFLWRAAGCPEPTSSYNPFGDVPTWQYYYKPVLWAVENGITKGVSDTTFEPDTPLTTQHIVTFLYRSMNPGKDGWDGEAAQWACKPYGGKPFGVNIEVNNSTPCPRRDVVQFLYMANAQG